MSKSTAFTELEKVILPSLKPAAEGKVKIINLKDLTLVAVDTVVHDLTRLAVEECLRKVDFGAVMIFSNQRIKISGSEHISCDATNLTEALLFRWRRVPERIRTSHYLTVEWDSWVLY
jgi:hypothetical protein